MLLKIRARCRVHKSKRIGRRAGKQHRPVADFIQREHSSRFGLVLQHHGPIEREARKGIALSFVLSMANQSRGGAYAVICA